LHLGYKTRNPFYLDYNYIQLIHVPTYVTTLTVDRRIQTRTADRGTQTRIAHTTRTVHPIHLNRIIIETIVDLNVEIVTNSIIITPRPVEIPFGSSSSSRNTSASALRTPSSSTKSSSKTKESANRRQSIRATRQQIAKPKSDEEFIREYQQYSPEEQSRRLSLIGNLPRAEYERRLALLEIQKEEVDRLLKQKERPLYDRIGLLADEHPEFFEEVSDCEEDHHFHREDTDIYPDDNEMGDMPPWVQALITNQQNQLNHLTQLIQQNNQNHTFGDTRPLRAEYIYEFSPTDSPDDTDYYMFMERINDMVAQYGEERIIPSLVSCLKTSRAKTWYTSLSEQDKTRLRTSTQDWKFILKRDFGIKPFRAKQLAQRETFSFGQNRPVLQYFNQKIACLKIADIDDEDMQCAEVKDGLKDPEYRSVIRLQAANNTISWLRQELTETESDCRSLWQKNQRLRPPFLNRYSNTEAQPKRGGMYRGRGRDTSYSQQSRSNMQSTLPQTAVPPLPGKQPLAITATASREPPRACRFCGGNHWDRECQFS
jgi:hypothetical protein